MSLLKRKELAKRKTELGNKINYVHNLITQHKIGENTSQESFAKVFKPVTSKLDDVIVSNLISKTPQRRRPRKKGEVPDYGIDIEDEVEDMNLGDLFDEQPVPPQQEKQIGPVPPPYEEFYIDPEYYQTKQKYPYPKEETPQNLPAYIPYEIPDGPPDDDLPIDDPPDYDEDQPIEFAINPDLERMVLDSEEINIPNYESVQKAMDQVADTNKRKIMVLNNFIKKASKKRQQIRGYKSHNTKTYKINNPDIWEMNKRKFNIQDIVLKRYINYLTNQKQQYKKGSGIRGRGIIKKMEKDRNRIKGYKADLTKNYKGGAISKANMQMRKKWLDHNLAVMNKYIKDHKKKLESEKKTKGRRRKQRGGNVMFFNNPKQLLNKLELIIGEIIAGNTSIKMRNTGVSILDTLLRMSTINKPQYNKLYKKYFKI